MRTLIAAIAQIDVVSLDVEANASRAVAAIEEAASRGAELTVLPELTNTGYVSNPDQQFMRRFWGAADEVNGPFTQQLRKAASELNVHVVVGIAEKHPQLFGVLRNVALLLTPDGIVHRYVKVHIPRLEKHYFQEGVSLGPIDNDLCRLGLLVCADNSFPEAARVLALKGTEILAVPYAAPEPVNRDLYQSMVVARAYENQIFVVASNRIGSHGAVSFAGGGTIAAPDGSVLAHLDAEPGVAVAELDAEIMMSERLRQTRFRDRRPHLYQGIVDGGTFR